MKIGESRNKVGTKAMALLSQVCLKLFYIHIYIYNITIIIYLQVGSSSGSKVPGGSSRPCFWHFAPTPTTLLTQRRVTWQFTGLVGWIEFAIEDIRYAPVLPAGIGYGKTEYEKVVSASNVALRGANQIPLLSRNSLVIFCFPPGTSWTPPCSRS